MKIKTLFKIIWINSWLNFRKPLVEIEIENIYDRLANKIIKHELLKMPDLNSESSANYYCNHNINIFHIQGGKWLSSFLGYSKEIPYWITPWGGCAKDYFKKKRLSVKHAEIYVSNFKKVENSIKVEGYNPKKYGYITGQLLINDKGERRFIVWNGYRRILSLTRLNYKKVTVEISGGDRWDGKIRNHTFNINEAKKWNNVKNNLYTTEEAKKFFNKFFE